MIDKKSGTCFLRRAVAEINFEIKRYTTSWFFILIHIFIFVEKVLINAIGFGSSFLFITISRLSKSKTEMLYRCESQKYCYVMLNTRFFHHPHNHAKLAFFGIIQLHEILNSIVPDLSFQQILFLRIVLSTLVLHHQHHWKVIRVCRSSSDWQVISWPG